MNRTIKFRGKRVDNGEWIEGNLLSINNHYEIGWQESSTYEIEGGWEQYEVQSNTVGQFTGLHDKNGKEIYEGDIIEVILQHNKETASTYKAVVEQKEGAFGFGNKQGFCPFYGQTYETFKVIGNIHDNPELMEGGEKK